jgi:hypothetical protein
MGMKGVLPEGKYASCANGYRIHYLDEGAGDNVVVDINLKGRDYVSRDGKQSNMTVIEGWKIGKSEIY